MTGKTRYLSIANWQDFQHYKDRNAPWIKLGVDLLQDYSFGKLADETRCHFLMICLLAVRLDNQIPYDPDWVGKMIQAHKRVDLDALIRAGLLTDYSTELAKGKREDWESRHISPDLRQLVLDKCESTCVQCGATDDLEIDHITPISKGGTSEESNLQVLCRRCNRAKKDKDVDTTGSE